MYLPNGSSDKQSRLLDMLESWKKKNLQADYKITDQIRALNIQLQDVQKNFSHIHDDVYWTKLHEHFFQISTKVRKVSQCHTIIASLRYECMEVRHDAIRDAHKRTFDWMYTPHGYGTSVQQPNTGLAEWLQSGSGIYWVTGKPGEHF